MMAWKVTGGDGSLVVELRDDETLFWTELVTEYFHDTLIGKTLFDDVAQPPLFLYFADGDEDSVAAFLNAVLYLPNNIVEGDPPVDVDGDDCLVPPDPMDRLNGEEHSVEKSLPDDDIPSDIRMLMLAVTDEDVVADAAEAIGDVKDAQPSRHPGATRLRIYWTRGEGAAKIKWGVPNDFYRCLDHLTKYVGTRAKGLCAIYHKASLGVWPGREHNKQFDWTQDNVYIALKDLVLDNGETPSEGETQ